tara:strand:+ start:1481 stop:1777 length:297 start_codon:yes stop_codon:yes gene_type:complete
MPSKLGFGDSRKKAGKAEYGSSMYFKSPVKKGTLLPEVEVSGGKGGKSLSQRKYEKNLDTKASELYMGDRGTRSGGTDFNTADEKTKAQYRAKAQRSL